MERSEVLEDVRQCAGDGGVVEVDGGEGRRFRELRREAPRGEVRVIAHTQDLEAGESGESSGLNSVEEIRVDVDLLKRGELREGRDLTGELVALQSDRLELGESRDLGS